jgi:hypothetical protein
MGLNGLTYKVHDDKEGNDDDDDGMIKYFIQNL